MIKGMTGFGSAQLAKGKNRATVEIKSVNHRYFDTSYYLPTGFASLENKIRQLLQKSIQRGRITLSVRITKKPDSEITLNKNIAKNYLNSAQVLQKTFNLDNDLKLSDLIRLPGVLETNEVFVKAESIWPELEKGIEVALNNLMVMRKKEGKSLSADVADKAKRMLAQVKTIRARAATILKQKKKTMTVEEFKSYQKNIDIEEEITRLSHYIYEVKSLLKSTVPVGKKMDFIAQEMQRETNTIGSKLQDSAVSNAVIALKSKIEKIREQSQNIE
ncbi:MAG: YicC family protein [Candidatus Omnitrophica bacterium]|nr:YicC family protein [Candidatus Omnitrophota bacterium]MBU1995814.1 YicC family protein [Candidatus Omnitrophota bacterium]MBU4334168.1 YicC family protein [Candidatus Omnitrophota bacterium]